MYVPLPVRGPGSTGVILSLRAQTPHGGAPFFYRGFPAHRRPATRTPRPGTHISPPVRAPGSSKADHRNAPPPVALAPPSGLGSRHEYRGCCAEHGKVHVRWLACACWPCMSGVCDCKHASRSEPASTYDTTARAGRSPEGVAVALHCADHDDEVTRWDDSVGRHARRCRAGRGARARRKARLKTGGGRRAT